MKRIYFLLLAFSITFFAKAQTDELDTDWNLFGFKGQVKVMVEKRYGLSPRSDVSKKPRKHLQDKTEYIFNEEGLLVRVNFYYDRESPLEYQKFFYEEGYLKGISSYTQEGKFRGRKVPTGYVTNIKVKGFYHYDGGQNLKMETFFSWNDLGQRVKIEGVSKTDSTSRYTIQYWYNKRGHIHKMIADYHNDPITETIEHLSYDSNGNWLEALNKGTHFKDALIERTYTYF